MKASYNAAGVDKQYSALFQAAKQAFYNVSPCTLRDMRARASQQQIEANFRAWMDGFLPNVQDILGSYEFRNRITRLSKDDALGYLVRFKILPARRTVLTRCPPFLRACLS